MPTKRPFRNIHLRHATHSRSPTHARARARPSIPPSPLPPPPPPPPCVQFSISQHWIRKKEKTLITLALHPLSSMTRSLERCISPCLGVGPPVLFRVPTLRCRACEKRGEGGAGERHKGMLNIPLGRSVPLCPRRGAATQPLRADRGQAASSLRDVVAWRSAALALPPSVYSILRPSGDVDVGSREKFLRGLEWNWDASCRVDRPLGGNLILMSFMPSTSRT